MLQRLGLRQLAYDYRDDHVPTFDDEISAMQQHGIDIVAWWFPVTVDDAARHLLAVFERRAIQPQLWVSGWDNPGPNDTAESFLAREVARIREIALAAQAIGCTVGLYNHGGWFGRIDNQLAIIERLHAEGLRNVGIVYNFHHGHDDIADFPALWRRMQSHVLAINLNGMVRDGERVGRKIVTLGDGEEELALMRVIQTSGWRGLVGILDHQPEVDAEVSLRANLAGLRRLRASLAAE